MKAIKIRFWAFILMVLACSFAYASAASLVPAAGNAASAMLFL